MSVGSIETVKVIDSQGVEKNFDIKKGGVSKAMELQGIFMTCLSKSPNISLDDKTEDLNFIKKLQTALDEPLIKRIKKVVVELTNAPSITEDSFEELDIKTVISLFMEIYVFNVVAGQKKKES